MSRSNGDLPEGFPTARTRAVNTYARRNRPKPGEANGVNDNEQIVVPSPDVGQPEQQAEREPTSVEGTIRSATRETRSTYRTPYEVDQASSGGECTRVLFSRSRHGPDRQHARSGARKRTRLIVPTRTTTSVAALEDSSSTTPESSRAAAARFATVTGRSNSPSPLTNMSPPRTPPPARSAITAPPDTGLRTPPRSIERAVSPSPRKRKPNGEQDSILLTPRNKQRQRMLTRAESFGQLSASEDDVMDPRASPARRAAQGVASPGSLGESKSMEFAGELGTTPSKDRAEGNGSIPSTPSRRLGKSQSMPESPSRNAADRAINSSAATGPRTYGARRTHLAEVAISLPSINRTEAVQQAQELLAGHSVAAGHLEEDDVLQKLGARPVPKMRESYTELKRKYATGVLVGEGGAEGQEDDADVNVLPPSMADLRSKGENRAFLDEVGYLVEGMSSSAVAAVRAR